MSYFPGVFVISNNRVCVIADTRPPDQLVIHLLDDNGETVLKESNDRCPATGNPRSHVAYSEVVRANDVRPATYDELPAARKPQPAGTV